MSTFDQLLDEMVKHYQPPPGELSPPTKLLVADLERSRTDANKAAVDEIIARAKTEAFHDFLTESATPLLDLQCALYNAGLKDLAKAVEEGKYDA